MNKNAIPSPSATRRASGDPPDRCLAYQAEENGSWQIELQWGPKETKPNAEGMTANRCILMNPYADTPGEAVLHVREMYPELTAYRTKPFGKRSKPL